MTQMPVRRMSVIGASVATLTATLLTGVPALGADAQTAVGGVAGAGTATSAIDERVTESAARTAVVAAVGDIACSPDSQWFAGGNGTGTYCRQLATARAAQRFDPDAVLALGDLQYENGNYDHFKRSFALSWGRFQNSAQPSRNRLWPVPGNHEYSNTESSVPAAGYFAWFNGGTVQNPAATGIAGATGKGWYSRQIGEWKVIALNDNCYSFDPRGCGTGTPQYEWLRRTLANSTATCTLAYWHQPRFTTGDHPGTTTVAPFWRLLHRYGADVVLNGHNHSYERFPKLDPAGARDPQGIREFVVGTGGKNLYAVAGKGNPRPTVADDTTSGVLKLTLKPKRYEWEFVRARFGANGQFTDTGSSRCVS